MFADDPTVLVDGVNGTNQWQVHCLRKISAMIDGSNITNLTKHTQTFAYTDPNVTGKQGTAGNTEAGYEQNARVADAGGGGLTDVVIIIPTRWREQLILQQVTIYKLILTQ